MEIPTGGVRKAAEAAESAPCDGQMWTEDIHPVAGRRRDRWGDGSAATVDQK